MSYWLPMLRQILVNNSLYDWLAAALVFLLTFTVLPLVRSYLRARRSHYANRDLPPPVALFAYLMDRTSRFVLWIVALYVADRILTLPQHVDRGLEIAIIAGCWLQIGIWAGAAARFWLPRQQARAGDPRLAGSIDIVLFALRLIIWIVVALLALENLGVNVGPLIAGLGVGGIAIALAVQTILGDLFASLSIALDKPFGLGDSLRIDTFEGVVEQIGIKSTRLRSVTGEQIIISNADLLKSRVRNLGRASEWRALFNLALEYDTPPALIDQVPHLVKDAVASYDGTRFVYCLLKLLGESAMLFEVCFFVENGNGRELGRALDQVNREILRTFARLDIRLATPVRTVWLRDQRAPEAPLADEPRAIQGEASGVKRAGEE
jgi:small-conductance mechanosensitive channel